MISIIVSSYQPTYFDAFCENIKRTIGQTPYEIIQIPNPNKLGICKAYNLGASQAKYNCLVFAHEDILFHTPNWGKVLLDTFQSSSSIGLVGVAGTFYKSWICSGWNLLDAKYSSINMIHAGISPAIYVKAKNRRAEILTWDENTPLVKENFELPDLYYEQVVAIDGFFMATTKSVYETNRFDEQNFPNFHGYDLDFAFQVQKSHQIVVSHNILIEHFSSGSFNKEWFKSTEVIHNKWSKEFPKSVQKLSRDELLQLEKQSLNILFSLINQAKYGYGMLIKQIYNLELIHVIGFRNWVFFHWHIISKSITITKKQVIQIFKSSNQYNL